MTTKVSLIADSSVTGAAINNLTITTDDIANNAVTTSKIDFGTALVPLGGIIMWSGVTAPSGYQLCNGTDLPSTSPLRPGVTKTPDLRERFVVGAGGNNTTQGQDVAGTNGYNVGDFGGSAFVTLGSNNVPAHSHGVSNFSDPGGHRHNTFNADVIGGGSLGQDYVGEEIGRPYASYTGSHNNNENFRYQIRGSGTEPDRGLTSSSGGHTHSFTINNAFGNAQGGTDAHENRPPYYALAFIMRVL